MPLILSLPPSREPLLPLLLKPGIMAGSFGGEVEDSTKEPLAPESAAPDKPGAGAPLADTAAEEWEEDTAAEVEDDCSAWCHMPRVAATAAAADACACGAGSPGTYNMSLGARESVTGCRGYGTPLPLLLDAVAPSLAAAAALPFRTSGSSDPAPIRSAKDRLLCESVSVGG